MGRPRASTITVATSDRLLDAALAEFARRGFDGARLEDIAAVAGITRPSLLYHFKTKELLYTATLARAAQALSEMILEAIGAQGTFRDRLHFLVEGFLSFADANPAVCRLLLRTLVNDGEGETRRLYVEQVTPLIDDVMTFFGRDGDADLRPGVPLRAALVSVVVNVLSKRAAGDLRAPLWGSITDDDTWLFVERALLRAPAEAHPTTNLTTQEVV